jgi:putative glutathione S-transferase
VSSESSRDGRFERQESHFRSTIEPGGEFEPASGRYHLYVALACPWSHRVVISRELKGLENVIGISYADPYRDERGWCFSGGRYVDDVNGFSFLSEAYERSDASFEGRVSVPVLWDKQSGQIVNNESSDLMRIFDSQFGEWAEKDITLAPGELISEIDELGGWIYEEVNNGVYRAGFARTQEAYEEAFDRLFSSLDRIEKILSGSRYLVGDQITEADWRLFVTLVRFDAVYYVHFKCNRRRIVDFPNLWGYLRELYQQPGIAATVSIDEIKRHYYTTHDMINPSRIIPAGPKLDFLEPHGRDAPLRP